MNLRRALPALLVALAPGVTFAQSVWDGGAGTSLWSDANNWSANTLPTAGSAVQFTGTSPYAISLNGDRSVASLLFSGNSSYTLSNNTLTLSGGITTSSPATGNVTHTIASALSLAAPTISVASSANLALTGNVTASGAVTKSGAGTLILAGDTTFSAGATVSAGTLQIGNGGATGTLAGDVVNNATVTFNLNRSSSYDYTGNMSGTGALVQNSNNTVRLGGTNTFTGGITISSSVLTIGTAGTTGSIACDVLNNSILIFNRTTDYAYSGNITGTGTIYKVNANTLGGNNTFSGGANLEGGVLAFSSASNLGTGGTFRVSGGTLQWASGNTADISGNRTVYLDAGGATFDVGSNSVTLASAIGNNGTGTLKKSGSGTLTLGGNNTYSGGTTINAGTVKFSALNNLGTGAITLDGGTLQWASGNTADITARTVTIGSGGGTFNLANNVTLAGNITGAGALTRSGSNTLTLTGNNTYSGGTVFSGGVVAFSALSNLGTGNLTFDGGTLRWGTGNTVDITARTITINSGGASWDTNGNDVTLTGSFSSANALTKSGNGNLTLSGGAVTVGKFVTSGPFVIKNGAVFTSVGQALVATITGTTVTLDGSGTTWNTGTNLYLGSGATLTASGGASLVSTGTSTVSKDSGTATLTVTGNGTSWSFGQLQLGFGQSSGSTTTGNLTISGGATASGTSALLGIAAKGVGNVVVDGANSTLTLSSYIQFGNNSGTGTLAIQNGGAVRTPSVTGNGTITFNNGTFGLTATDTIDNPLVLGSGGGTLEVASGKTATLAGGVSGNGSFTKTGDGTLSVTATNTYTGATTISGGTFRVAATTDLGSTSGVTVSTGGTLVYNASSSFVGALTLDGGTVSGTGSLASYVLTGSGTVDPGDAIGILTAGATNGADGLAYAFEFGRRNSLPTWNAATASGNDLLRLNASTPFRSTLQSFNVVSVYLDFTSVNVGDVFTGGFYADQGGDFLAKVSGATYQVYLSDAAGGVSYNGATYSSFGGTITVGTSAQSADFSGGTANGYVLQFTVATVPEPPSALLGAAGAVVLALLGLHRRRQRR